MVAAFGDENKPVLASVSMPKFGLFSEHLVWRTSVNAALDIGAGPERSSSSDAASEMKNVALSPNAPLSASTNLHLSTYKRRGDHSPLSSAR